MRVDRQILEKYKGFERRELVFHPQFNLVVGENGAGKTAVLDGLAIAAGSWFLGLRGYDSRCIRAEDVRLQRFGEDPELRWERQFPCQVEAQGVVQGSALSWRRTLRGEGGHTTFVDARTVKVIAELAELDVRAGRDITLPLISYYGTGRLWGVPREQAQATAERTATKVERSRLSGYRNSVDPRLSVRRLVDWIARQEWVTFQRQGKVPEVYRAVRQALVRSVDGARELTFDAGLGEVVVRFDGGETQPFTNLSDGQRCMLAVVGDIAQKAATLNPHLNGKVLAETPGVVLVDELDLHLHPTWQRHVVEDLRTTFPRLQFVCTTHSPFLIQSLRSGEELVMLDGQPTAQLGSLSIEDIARGIQGVANPSVGVRYEEMKAVARHYLETLDEATTAPRVKLAAFKERLARDVAPYADNPAFQAFLEMKRVAKLGE